MQRGAKRIDPSHKREISIIKSYILDSRGRGFDGDGYPFKKALSELRKEGYIIKYNSDKCHYALINNN